MASELRWGYAVALFISIGSSARASDDAEVIRRATKLLEEIASTPESGIPSSFLREAKGITIMPHMVETELGLGRKRGHGVYLPRDEKGEWGNPEFIEMSGLSVGAEAGRKVTDMVMIYRTKKAAEKHAEETFGLGASFVISGSLQQPHKFHGPRPDDKQVKDVATYTRRRGILVGAKIMGEHKTGRAPAPGGPRTATTPDPKATDEGAKATKTGVPDQKPQPGRDTPEAARLKTLLTALTATPAAEVAEKGTKDPKVGPASGPIPATENAPRTP